MEDVLSIEFFEKFSSLFNSSNAMARGMSFKKWEKYMVIKKKLYIYFFRKKHRESSKFSKTGFGI